MKSYRVTATGIAPVLIALVLAAAPQAAAQPGALSLEAPDLAAALHAVPVGERLTVEVPALGSGSAPGLLDLERFEVFAADARILVHGDGGTRRLPPPANAYFEGRLDSDPRVRALLTARASGGVRGVLAGPGAFWVIAPSDPAAPASTPVVRKLDAGDDLAIRLGGGFGCATDELPAPPRTPPAGAVTASAAMPRAPAGRYAARVALETDHEYYNLFSTDVDRIDYLGDLVAYSSSIYDAEVDTRLLIGEIHLWATAADPWEQTSARCTLYEYGRYWNDHYTGVDRTFTHFVSGRNQGGGIAWVGVLCGGSFNVDHGGACPLLAPQNDNYGGAYGYSGSITGSFDVDNPGVVWDIVVFSHEIGHNFNSPHSHCYNGIGGPEPVDQCYGSQAGCYSGTPSLPCPTPGAGCGTLMSYCHLLGGGLANFSLTFGLGHPWGVDPERVPTRMIAHTVDVAAIDPACLQRLDLFRDGFESGGLGAWSASVP